MKRWELIIFDCDGVLVDSEWLANQIEVEALKNLGFSITFEDYLDLSLGRTSDEVEEALQKKWGIKFPCDYREKVQEQLFHGFKEKLTAICGVEALVQSLAIPSCIASSSDAARLELSLRTTGLYPYFEGRIFGRECVQRGKPEPDIFLFAAAERGISPSNCLVIEDSLHGVEAAAAAGMEVWGFTGGKHLNSSMKKTLSESKASRTFNRMEEIGALLCK